MLFLILFILVAIAVFGFALYWVVQGLGLEEIPPPEPMPFVTSAVGTGAHTIHLALYKGSGQGNLEVELERYRPSDQTTSFFLRRLKSSTIPIWSGITRLTRSIGIEPAIDRRASRALGHLRKMPDYCRSSMRLIRVSSPSQKEPDGRATVWCSGSSRERFPGAAGKSALLFAPPRSASR
jgi:hypothetical protein